MAFAPPTKNKQQTTNIAKSTWTPMTNTGANSQVFEERRTIIQKWFEKWNEKQRRIVIDDIFKSLSEKHLLAVHNELRQKFPEEKFDFTKRLPRVLSLYVFSFLDPRSLCRCSQVSWYWKYLTELDCVWRPKCLRFGWYPTHQPSQYEETIWKRHYIATIHQLHYVKAKEEPKHHEFDLKQPDTARTDRTQLSTARSHMSSASTSRRKKASFAPKSVPIPAPKWEPPPWKGSDPNPTDTMRYNYLDNKQKDKQKNPRRPKSASGSVVLSGRKSVQGPVKSSMEPRPSTAVKNSSVTQSLDLQSLSNKPVTHSSGGKLASERNMMSASVSNFTYTGASPNLHGSMNGGATLQASTYYVSTSSPIQHGMSGTLNTSTHYTSGLHSQSPVLSSSSPQHSKTNPPDLSNLTMKDATVRPKPVARLSTDKSFSQEKEIKPDVSKPDSSPTVPAAKPLAKTTKYEMKEAGKGKSIQLQGSPWKPKEVGSDDSDF
uniref:F-box only protein 16-like n=1 Tax=Styela clava TaxID=7725 RepID=UPI00193ABD20|nr:F-box only protein 16-like [Styela clava]